MFNVKVTVLTKLPLEGGDLVPQNKKMAKTKIE